MRKTYSIFFVSTVSVLFFVLPEYALAYIGPGAGISAIGTVIALLGAVLLAIVGFVWYPIKRLLSRKKEKGNNEVKKKSDKEKEGRAREGLKDESIE
jgi:hypothetical protein